MFTLLTLQTVGSVKVDTNNLELTPSNWRNYLILKVQENEISDVVKTCNSQFPYDLDFYQIYCEVSR